MTAPLSISVPPRAHPAWVVLQLPQTLDPGSDQQFDGVRIDDERGNETPYVLNPSSRAIPSRTVPIAVLYSQTVENGRKTGVMLTLPADNTPITLVDVSTSTMQFSRPITLSASDDEITWTPIGSGLIQRFARGRPDLRISVDSTSRYVRASIENGDDAPLKNLRLTLRGPARYLVFIAAPKHSYELRVLPQANAPPLYDLKDLFEHDNPARFLRAHVEPVDQRQAARYRVPPFAMNAAFALAIAIMAMITLGTMRTSRTRSPR